MKAVVLEVKGDYVVIMKDDGTIEKMKNDNYYIGGVIEMKESKVSLRTKLSTLVAALLIFAMIGTGTWANASKAYEVIVEGEDEISIEVNRSKDILSIDLGEYEEDLEDFNFEGMDIMEALEIILDELGLESDDVSLVTTVAKDEDKAEKLATQIRERIQDNEDNNNELAKEEREREREENTNNDEDKVITNGMGYEKVQAARELNITPGKYNLITRNLEIDPDDEDEMDEYIGMSNQEIMQIYSNQKGEKNGVKFNEEDQSQDKDQIRDQDQVHDPVKDQDQIRDQDQVQDPVKDQDQVRDQDEKDKNIEQEKELEQNNEKESNSNSNGNGNSNSSGNGNK
ncbi:MAG: hypothetical protein RBR71_04940 [Gudongella sp.]|nr:hypothetical protein [Gudongella sp.]